MELKVYYKIPKGIDENLDKAIAEAVSPFGLIRWAAGLSLIDGERDLAFGEKHRDQSNVVNIWPRRPDSG